MEKAFDKDLEQRAWEMWRASYTRGEKVKPFNEYLAEIKRPKNTDCRNEEEIISDAQSILKMKHS